MTTNPENQVSLPEKQATAAAAELARVLRDAGITLPALTRRPRPT